MTGILETNDATPEYLAHRTQVAEADIVQRNLERVRQAQAQQQPAGGEQKPDAAAPAGGGTRQVPRITMGRPGEVAFDTVPAGPQDGLGSTLGAVATDLAKGATEAPLQALGGVSDAVRNTALGFSRLGDWLDEKLPMLRVAVPKTGSETVDQLLADPFKLIAGDGKQVPEAQSVTGGVVRDVARFLTGFVPLFRAGRAAGMGQVAAGTAAGGGSDAITADPQAANFSDLLKAYPALQTPVTDFLSSNPEDPEVLARFKKGLEGAGLGLLTDGFILATKAMIMARRSGAKPEQLAAALAEQKAQYGQLADRDFLAMGDPNGPLVERRGKVQPPAPDANVNVPMMKIADADAATVPGVPDQVAATGVMRAAQDQLDVIPSSLRRATEGSAPAGPKGELFINWNRITSGDDVKRVIQDMADAMKPEVDEARRGVQTNKATRELADRLNMSVEDLLNRKKGEPFNAETATAAREILNSSAEKLLEMAKRAASPQASAVDQFNFRRMMALHHAIQAEVISARTETARALQAWSIPVGGSVEKAKAVQDILAQTGGPGFAKAMADRLAKLEAAGGTPQAIDAFVSKSWRAATFDVVQEAWINALLSSPKTHIVNMTSNLALSLNAVLERGLASRLSQVWEGSIAPGEATAMAYGMIMALGDAFRLAGKAVRTGERLNLSGKVDAPLEPAITGDYLRKSGHNGMAAAVDLLGKVTRTPTTLMGAEDAFFKTIGYRAEVYAQALRQATSEGLTGEQLYRRMAQLVDNPPESIRLAAADAAAYNTFTNATGQWGQAMLRLRQNVPPVAWVMPFISTPVNIARYSFERSPLAPLVAQWRNDIGAGGARAELALARMGAGSAIMALGFDLASRGMISGGGPDDAGEKANYLRQGWQPYSVKIGDRWVSYNRMDPLGMTMGFAADMAELLRRRDIEPEEVDEVMEVVAAGTAAVANVTINKTYMQGISNLFEMMGDADSRPDKVEAFLGQLAGSFVPAGVNAVSSAIDPVQRERMGVSDYITAKIAGLKESLPVKRDLWGEPMKTDSGFGPLYDAFAPMQVSKIKESPIDAELARLDMNINRIGKKVEFNGISVNLRDWPEVYDAYVRLAGNDLKHPAWGMGAKDLLNAIVTNKHDLSEVYNMKADTRKPEEGGKAQYIASIIAQFREMARREILADPKFSRFADEVGAKKAKRDAGKMPELQ